MILPAKASFLLFDMDGTLVDTEPVGPRTFVKQLRVHGKQPTEAEYALFCKIWRRDGTKIKQDDWLPSVAQKYNIGISPDNYLKEFYEMYLQAIITAPALPGAGHFLRTINATGRYKAALVTASKRPQVQAVIEHHNWNGLFDVLVTSEDFTAHKPIPEPFLVAMGRLGALPNGCIVFEDSKNGAISAHAAGCYVVGLRAGNSTIQDLGNADMVVDSFDDIELP